MMKKPLMLVMMMDMPQGYNTQCQIRSTMIYGHFDSEEYSRGYNTGKYDGAQACIVDRKNNNVR